MKLQGQERADGAMSPVLIGYFPRHSHLRSEDSRASALPPQIEEFCEEGHMHDGAPTEVERDPTLL